MRIGIDLGGTKIEGVVLGPDGQELARRRLKTPRGDYQDTVDCVAEIVREPTPFGVTLRLTNDLTRIKDQVQQDQTLNTALALFDYAISPQLMVGLRGGYESTNYTVQESAGTPPQPGGAASATGTAFQGPMPVI